MDRFKHGPMLANVGRASKPYGAGNLRGYVREDIPIEVGEDDDVEDLGRVGKLCRSNVDDPVFVFYVGVLFCHLFEDLVEVAVGDLHDVVFRKAGHLLTAVVAGILEGIAADPLGARVADRLDCRVGIGGLVVLDSRVEILFVLPDDDHVHIGVLGLDVGVVSDTRADIGIEAKGGAYGDVKAPKAFPLGRGDRGLEEHLSPTERLPRRIFDASGVASVVNLFPNLNGLDLELSAAGLQNPEDDRHDLGANPISVSDCYRYTSHPLCLYVPLRENSSMLKELFETQQGYINAFFNTLDLEQVEALLEQLLACEGAIVFTGVGKSGLVAEKLAMTMVSTGVRAYFLPPTNALHGDLGILHEGDVFICLSKSGESDELLSLIPFVRNKGACPVAWVSSKGSRLEKACDLSIYLPLERELCPFDLAPTTSDAVQLIFGNVLAVAMMKKRNFSLDDYAANHPAGQIGKRITVRVSDLMLSGAQLPRAQPEISLCDALVELSDKRCGCLLVCDEEDQLQGIFTDGDLRRALQTHGPQVLQERLDSLMNRTFKSISPKALAFDAMNLMEADQKKPIMVLPVVEESRVRGLIKMHDILQSGL